MTKGLIIVESPTKAKTIQKYVGKEYKVMASVGHIKDLPKNRLGVDVQDGFKPHYEILKGKGRFLKEIKKAAQEATDIYLASDPDREGEAIAWHIAEEVNGPGKRIHRALFNDLSKETVLKSLENPTHLDPRKVEAQMARRILDRIVGYEISPMLWEKVKRGLSAGRVQSVAVRLVCERQREIDSFVPEEYWTITAKLQAQEPPPFEAKLFKAHGQKAKIPNEQEAKKIIEEIRGLSFRVSSIETKPLKRKPPAPFTTSKLQQEAYRRLKFSAKKTMILAQQLYEGVELGPEGPVGLITYMRTDSVRVAPHALEAVRKYILGSFGEGYLPSKPNVFKSAKGAQEAHEAIRPTSVERTPEEVKEYLTKDQYALYKLIWERFVASQMKPAVYDRTTVEVEAGPYLFRATGAVLVFPGFTAIYGAIVDGEGAEQEALFPPLKEGEDLSLLDLLPQQHFTQPPPPFTEATLVKELEERGIGRPSTYATILSNIQERGYVKVERGAFRPTELGFLVTDLLVKSFPAILDVGFTAEMEEKLDRIEEGELDRLKVLEEFYRSFREDFERAQREMQDLKREGLPTEMECEVCGSPLVVKMGKRGPFLSCSSYPSCTFSKPYMEESQRLKEEPQEGRYCPKCGSPMVVREGRFGPFLACSAYPSCRTTEPLKEAKGEEPQEVPPPSCPQCNSPMVMRNGRFGRFFACSRYPKCKGKAPVDLGIPCPVEGCSGKIVERRSKKGRIFFSCSNYPGCQFLLWQRPIAKACPSCGASFLVRKSSRGKNQLVCIKEGCGYEEDSPS
jgi:DNA topoisomerase-1